MTSRDAPRARWIGKASPAPSRWNAMVPLGLLIAVGLGLFVYLVLQFLAPGPQTRLALIEITEYGDRYPVLSPTSSTPWQKLIPNPENKNQVKSREQVLEKLSRLKNPAPQGDHTLFLVLRCFAAMNHNGGCELLIGESESTNLSMQEFLKAVVECDFRNAIIVADICDLHYYPYLGYVANPIETAVRNDCQSIQEKLKGRNLWILCAAADGQPSFRDRDGKTLFQEGVVEALRLEKNPTEKNFSLQSFYQKVLDHCSTHSRGTQTPVLIEAKQTNGSQRISIAWRNLDPEPKSWFTSSNESTPEQTDEEAKKEIEKIEYASFQEYWSLVQKTREPFGSDFVWQPWRPSERDPFVWRKALAKQAILDFDLLKNPNTDPLPWSDWIHSPPSTNQNGAVGVWEKPSEGLSGPEAEKWIRVQVHLREYCRNVADWVAWRDLVFSQPFDPDQKMLKSFLEVSKNLGKVSRILQLNVLLDPAPKESVSWLEAIQSDPLDDLEKVEKEIVDQLEKIRRDIARDLTREKAGWSWMLEQRLLAAIPSPLFSAEQRKSMLQQFKEIHLRKSTKIANQDGSQDGSPQVSKTGSLKDRFDLFRDAMKEIDWEPLSEGQNTSKDLSDKGFIVWGEAYRKRHGQEVPNDIRKQTLDSSFRLWLDAAMRDLPPPKNNENDNAIKIERAVPLVAFFPGNPNQKRLSLKRKVGGSEWKDADWIDIDPVDQVKQEFQLELSNAGETSKLQWRVFRDGKPLTKTAGIGFRVKSDIDKEGETWIAGEPRTWSAKSIRMEQLRPSEAKEISPPDLGRPNDEIVFEWLDDGNTLEDRVPIFFNEKRLDLVLRPLVLPPKGPVYPQPDRESKYPLLGIEFLAIEDLPVSFSVEVRNKSRRPRRALVVLFENIGKKNTLLKSKPVDLIADEQKVIELELDTNPIKPGTSTRNLLWRIEELKGGESSEPPAGSDKKAESDKKVGEWIFRSQFLPINPGGFIEIKGSDEGPKVDQKYDLPIRLRDDFWTRVPTDRKEVRASVRWKDRNNPNIKGSYDVSIPRLAERQNANNAFLQRPVLQQAGSDLQYELDIAGYPRARFIEFEFSDQPKPDILFSSPPKIEETSPLKIRAIAKDDEIISTTEDGSNRRRIIIPTWNWNDGDNPGSQKEPPTRLEIQGIQIEAVAGNDFFGLDGWREDPKRPGQMAWCLDDPSTKVSGIIADRDVVIADSLKSEGGVVSFSPKIVEAKAEIIDRLFNPKTSSEFTFKLGIGSTDACENSDWSRTLVFDGDKPEKGELQTEPTLWRGDAESYRVKLVWQQEPDRGGSGIRDGFLAWTPSAAKFDFADSKNFIRILTPGRLSGREMVFEIAADDIKELKEKWKKPIDIRLHAVVRDNAGNFRDDFEPKDVRWEPGESK
jgi:hypothetical protein